MVYAGVRRSLSVMSDDGTMSDEEWWQTATRFTIIWFIAVAIGAGLLLVALL